MKLRHLLAILLLSTVAVFAQDPAPAAQAAATAPAAETKTLWALFKVGGWSMWPLALCSVAAIGLAIYNGINLRPSKFLRPDVFAKLRDAVRKYDIRAAKSLCEAEPCPITNIAHPGLDRIEENGEIDIASVEKGMEEAATQEVASHMAAINYISVIAVIAPMIGLLGTVSGMIKAFSNMATLGMGRPERLADNISEALITTASGLIVGIPAMVIYFYFKNRYTGHIAAINRMAGELMENLKKALRSAQREHAAAAHALTQEVPAQDSFAEPTH